MIPFGHPGALAAGSLGAGLLQFDRLRRSQGRLFDGVGLAPAETPFRIAWSASGVRLRHYGGDGSGPVLLIVPAPIKRATIWDLVPWASVVRRCRDRGLTVYLVEWIDPGPEDRGWGLAEYAGRFLLGCLDAVRQRTGRSRLLLAGHSLGGTLAAVFAALHPDRVRGLIALEAPMNFGRDAGDFAPLIAMAPPGGGLGPIVPGSFLDLVTVTASPLEFVWDRWADLIGSLGDARAIETHLRVARWTLDEFALPGRLFGEIVEDLYRTNRFMRGGLTVDGRIVTPADLAAPVLTVFDPRSTVIPPQSILPFHDALPTPDKHLLDYRGDRGVAIQHVGVLVGRNAHARLWPHILDWMGDRWQQA